MIKDLQRDFVDRAVLESVLWEELPLPVTASFQQGIDVIVRERPIDIAFVCVKSYDTERVTKAVAPYLAKDGFMVKDGKLVLTITGDGCIDGSNPSGKTQTGMKFVIAGNSSGIDVKVDVDMKEARTIELLPAK